MRLALQRKDCMLVEGAKLAFPGSMARQGVRPRGIPLAILTLFLLVMDVFS